MAGPVLIVDDETDVTTYVATALRAHGFEAVVANSVDGGLRLLSEVMPVLVFLDIMMPQESGLSMYLRLRQNPATRRIPVVILSGVAQKGEFDFRSYIADLSVPGPDHYLEKPVPADELIAITTRFTARTGPHGKGRIRHA